MNIYIYNHAKHKTGYIIIIYNGYTCLRRVYVKVICFNSQIKEQLRNISLFFHILSNTQFYHEKMLRCGVLSYYVDRNKVHWNVHIWFNRAKKHGHVNAVNIPLN